VFFALKRVIPSIYHHLHSALNNGSYNIPRKIITETSYKGELVEAIASLATLGAERLACSRDEQSAGRKKGIKEEQVISIHVLNLL
jgi:hypothetical protein